MTGTLKPPEQFRHLPIEEIWDELVQSRRDEIAQKKRCTDAMWAAAYRPQPVAQVYGRTADSFRRGPSA